MIELFLRSLGNLAFLLRIIIGNVLQSFFPLDILGELLQSLTKDMSHLCGLVTQKQVLEQKNTSCI